MTACGWVGAGFVRCSSPDVVGARKDSDGRTVALCLPHDVEASGRGWEAALGEGFGIPELADQLAWVPGPVDHVHATQWAWEMLARRDPYAQRVTEASDPDGVDLVDGRWHGFPVYVDGCPLEGCSPW